MSSSRRRSASSSPLAAAISASHSRSRSCSWSSRALRWSYSALAPATTPASWPTCRHTVQGWSRRAGCRGAGRGMEVKGEFVCAGRSPCPPGRWPPLQPRRPAVCAPPRLALPRSTLPHLLLQLSRRLLGRRQLLAQRLALAIGCLRLSQRGLRGPSGRSATAQRVRTLGQQKCRLRWHSSWAWAGCHTSWFRHAGTLPAAPLSPIPQLPAPPAAPSAWP